MARLTPFFPLTITSILFGKCAHSLPDSHGHSRHHAAFPLNDLSVMYCLHESGLGYALWMVAVGSSPSEARRAFGEHVDEAFQADARLMLLRHLNPRDRHAVLSMLPAVVQTTCDAWMGERFHFYAEWCTRFMQAATVAQPTSFSMLPEAA